MVLGQTGLGFARKSNGLCMTNCPPLPTDPTKDEPPAKNPRRERQSEPKEKPKQAASGCHILEPASSSISVAQLQQDFLAGKIMPPRLPQMQNIRNTTGVDLCFAYLLGQECSERGCGYHLSAAPPEKMPGTCHSDYAKFHVWVRFHKAFFKLSPKASSHSKLKLS